MNKAAWVGVGALAVSAFSSAQVPTLVLDDPLPVVPHGAPVTVIYTGTLSVPAGFDVSTYYWELAGLTQWGPYLSSVTISDSFNGFVSGWKPGIGYHGEIFSITLSGTEAWGLYAYNHQTLLLDATKSEFSASGYSDTLGVKTASATYGVQVVPEPTSLVSLTLVAAALARRRLRVR